ncbi:hypothetical protein CIPAW_14G127200 [Carya illinoinensis]|uniref:Uncharacterized protein n=1 Tax=Carya illinoinensis TaxID=32201 RepID=A0A8T1NI18_CARIL|nr:hypothetical protein CIPAW_14G127200 [Carya illinoinensis]
MTPIWDDCLIKPIGFWLYIPAALQFLRFLDIRRRRLNWIISFEMYSRVIHGLVEVKECGVHLVCPDDGANSEFFNSIAPFGRSGSSVSDSNSDFHRRYISKIRKKEEMIRADLNIGQVREDKIKLCQWGQHLTSYILTDEALGKSSEDISNYRKITKGGWLLGFNIPEWVRYKSSGSSTTIDLDGIANPEMGCAFFAVCDYDKFFPHDEATSISTFHPLRNGAKGQREAHNLNTSRSWVRFLWLSRMGIKVYHARMPPFLLVE